MLSMISMLKGSHRVERDFGNYLAQTPCFVDVGHRGDEILFRMLWQKKKIRAYMEVS